MLVRSLHKFAKYRKQRMMNQYSEAFVYPMGLMEIIV